MGLRMLHSGLSKDHFTTQSLSSTPYTVVRERTIIQMGLSTSTYTVGLFGAFQPTNAANGQVSASYGVLASGGGVPGTASDIILNWVNITGTTACRVRLHRLGISLVNAGGGGASAIPDGLVYVGLLRTPVDRASFTSYADLAAWVVGRPEVHTFTNYDLFRTPHHFTTAPADYIQWQTFEVPVAGANTMVANPSFGTIAVVAPSVSQISNLYVTVHAEFAVEYTANAVLQSTARLHPAIADPVWHAASAAAHAVGGFVEDAAAAAVGEFAARARPARALAIMG